MAWCLSRVARTAVSPVASWNHGVCWLVRLARAPPRADRDPCSRGPQCSVARRQVCYSARRLADAYELLGATFVDEHRDIPTALQYWRRALDLRQRDHDQPLVKPLLPPNKVRLRPPTDTYATAVVSSYGEISLLPIPDTNAGNTAIKTQPPVLIPQSRRSTAKLRVCACVIGRYTCTESVWAVGVPALSVCDGQVYLHRTEFSTYADLEELQADWDAVKIQSLLVTERVLGVTHKVRAPRRWPQPPPLQLASLYGSTNSETPEIRKLG